MLGEKNVLNKPEILRREAALKEPVKKRSWLFKVIVTVIIIVSIIYFFRRAGGIEGIRNLFNNFLGNLLK